MRYLTQSFALGALSRGRPIKQFLGPAGSPERPGIRYAEVRPTKTRYEIYLHTLEDVDHETFVDVAEFPPLYINDEEEESGRLVTTCDDPLGVLATAEDVTGAGRGRWVNAGMVQDEYLDYVVAERPANTSPDGYPWPVPPHKR
ncbi:hypothetical protein ACWC3X_44630 [Streptomyces populi]